MRREVDAAKVRALIEEIGRRAKGAGNVYFTGGATAVLEGWRATTVDIDLKLDPEPAGIFQAIADLKEELEINVESGFAQIEADLVRYPALDRDAFRDKLTRFLNESNSGSRR